MEIRLIRTDKDHRAALAEIEKLWGASIGTPEGDKLDVLVTSKPMRSGAGPSGVGAGSTRSMYSITRSKNSVTPRPSLPIFSALVRALPKF